MSIKEGNEFDLLFGNQIEKNINDLKNNLYDERKNSAKPNKILLFLQANTFDNQYLICIDYIGFNLYILN